MSDEGDDENEDAKGWSVRRESWRVVMEDYYGESWRRVVAENYGELIGDLRREESRTRFTIFSFQK